MNPGERRGTTGQRLRRTAPDVAFGMFFSALVMYSIIIATAATLHKSRQHQIETAAQAAQALTPIASHAATLLFCVGIVRIGFLAIPVMTTGAAYDVCQSFRCKNGLHLKWRESKVFYGVIVAVMVVAAGFNFLGVNPMKALVIAGIVQGFSTPSPLMLLIMLLTNKRSVVGDKVNTRLVNGLGWATTAITSTASLALLSSYVR